MIVSRFVTVVAVVGAATAVAVPVLFPAVAAVTAAAGAAFLPSFALARQNALVPPSGVGRSRPSLG